MTFKPNPAGFAELERAVATGDAAIAEAWAAEARANAPVDTGAYRDGIRVVRDGDAVAVVATAPHSLIVEFGTADTPAFAPILRAGDSIAPRAAQIASEALR